jgi:alkanesulfonate monooxygenase SsuD/methylene tetrahydromethanopterin reductase-like flavin-dependent oxidoreductase (luciferase family)
MALVAVHSIYGLADRRNSRMPIKFGVELGIRAPSSAVKRAAVMTDTNMLDYYFVPETHPKFTGVDAFEALEVITKKVRNATLATGIVNVYSRNKKTMLQLANNIYHRSEGRFVLGLGTSAPIIIENMYKMKFEKPLHRIKNYTDYIKNNHRMPVYWAVVGDKITRLAAKHADGVIFFLRPESEIKRSIKIIKNELAATGKKYDQFDIVSIRPTYIEEDKNAENMARMTIANYIGANEFYSKPLERVGFKKQTFAIRENFLKHGLAEAARHVSYKMIKELATFGNARECAEEMLQHVDRTKIKIAVAGFDLPKNSYNSNFFEKLQKLARRL